MDQHSFHFATRAHCMNGTQRQLLFVIVMQPCPLGSDKLEVTLVVD